MYTDPTNPSIRSEDVQTVGREILQTVNPRKRNKFARRVFDAVVSGETLQLNALNSMRDCSNPPLPSTRTLGLSLFEHLNDHDPEAVEAIANSLHLTAEALGRCVGQRVEDDFRRHVMGLDLAAMPSPMRKLFNALLDTSDGV